MVLAASRGRELPRQRPGGKKSFGEADRGLGWLVGVSEGTLGPEGLGGSGQGLKLNPRRTGDHGRNSSLGTGKLKFIHESIYRAPTVCRVHRQQVSKEQILSTRRYDLSGNGEKLLIVACPAVPCKLYQNLVWGVFWVFFLFFYFFLLLNVMLVSGIHIWIQQICSLYSAHPK